MEINYLSKLSPAETLLFVQGKTATNSFLLKVTLFDLIMKQVLTITEEERQHHQNDPPVKSAYIEIGKNFNAHTVLPHENFFLSPFLKNQDMRMLFRNVVKVAYNASRSSERFQILLVKNSDFPDAFSRTFFQRLISDYTITPTGRQIRDQVEEELNLLRKVFLKAVDEDFEKAKSIQQLVGGNIFLIPNLESATLQKINRLFLENEPKDLETTSSGCTTSWTWATFDSSCSSGCSGDSGCGGGDSGCSSGCSGCGGGCGGD